MLLMYGCAIFNGCIAMQLYQEHFPDWCHPNHATFIAVDCRLTEIETFKPVSVDWGRERDAQTPKGRVKGLAHEHLEGLTWTVASPLSFTMSAGSHACCFSSASELLLVFHSTKCWTFLCFISALYIWGHFGRDGIINIHKQDWWAEDNPHGIIHSRHQQQISINVWAGNVGDCLVGLHVLPHQLTGNHYWDFLWYDLPMLKEDVPLAVRTWMWYMHDGAPAHFSHAVGDVLNITYHDWWIGRGGPTAWPPC
jgi:hypothetical protein